MNNKYVKTAAITIPILMAAICLTLAVRNDNQASMPIPMSLTFTGEYSYDGDNWYPYNKDSDMSALDGDVTVRGYFDVDIDTEMENDKFNVWISVLGKLSNKNCSLIISSDKLP